MKRIDSFRLRSAPLMVASVLAFLALAPPQANVKAMLPNPEPYEIEQTDGSVIKVKMVGSEDDPFEEDEEGFVVIGTGLAGNEYEYAVIDEETGDLMGSGVPAGRRDQRPQGLRKGLRRRGGAREAMGLGGSGPAARQPGGITRGRGTGTSGGRGRGTAPTRRLDHVDMYDEWNEATEDFHRRTMSWRGTKRNLVIPMRFKGHESRWLPSKANLQILFNNNGPHGTYAPTGSVRDVFKVSSYGALDLVSDVEDWVQLSQTEAYYANGGRGFTTKMHQAMREALNILENNRKTDFSKYDTDNDGLIDAICFLHSGYAAEWGGNAEDGANYLDRIWSHKWSLYSFREPSTSRSPGWTSRRHNVRVYNYHISPAVYGTYPSRKTIKDKMGRIGVIAHETGHFLGITDLYDKGGDAGSGIGSWGLMANSWGFANNQWCIPIMSPWSKIDLGWLVPNKITRSGSFNISPSYNTKDVYRIDAGFPNDEYLLIEYRKKTGFESCMPTNGGLAIWHIDDKAGFDHQGWPGQAGWPANGKHYRISLLQADGKYELEQKRNRGDGKDLFYSGNKDYLGPSGNPDVYPNTDSYQGGSIVETGIRIKNIGVPRNTISFDVTMPGAPPSPVAAPVRSPMAAPTGGGGGGRTGSCSGSEYKLEIDITTDDFGSEITWAVEDQYLGGGVLQSEGPYQDKVQSYHYDYCLDSRSCYKFVINDKGGDGMSGARAGWKVTWNGNVVGKPGKNYAFSKDGVDFGNKCLPSNSKTAVVGKDGNKNYFGTMFDIRAKKDIGIRKFSAVHVNKKVGFNYKVFTKNGSYRGYERNASAWTKVVDTRLTGAGFKNYASVSASFNQFVPILGDTVQAFYVVFNRPEQVFLQGGSLKEGNVYKRFNDFDLTVGTYNRPNFGTFSTGAGFNGKIVYSNARVSRSGVLGQDDDEEEEVEIIIPDDELPVEDAGPLDEDVQLAVDEASTSESSTLIHLEDDDEGDEDEDEDMDEDMDEDFDGDEDVDDKDADDEDVVVDVDEDFAKDEDEIDNDGNEEETENEYNEDANDEGGVTEYEMDNGENNEESEYKEDTYGEGEDEMDNKDESDSNEDMVGEEDDEEERGGRGGRGVFRGGRGGRR